LQIVSPTLSDKTIYLDRTLSGETKEATFEIKLNGINGAKGKVRILSTRGGYIEKELEIGEVK
ncbi:MAG: hypothetical protein HWE07_03955, partial [Cytophagia bacterium]|nr:hypothetical protein [Cytophagia bacterium]